MEHTKNTGLKQPRYATSSDFYTTLKSRVEKELEGKSLRDHPDHYLKVFILFGLYACCLGGILTVKSPTAQISIYIFWGILNACIGFNLFHDAIHGSLSKRKWVNRLFAFLSSSLIGGGRYNWYFKHNILHHQYPNIQDWDDDLETRGHLRFSPHQPWSPKYTYQWLYCPFIYALTTLEWLLVKDFIQYFSGKLNENYNLPKMTKLDHAEFIFSKIFFILLTVVLPLQVMSFGIFIGGYLLHHFFMSWTLAAIFQLAHVEEECEFPTPDKSTGNMENDWAIHQMVTTTNYSMTNPFITWFSGGLNYQVEHHLYPHISHIHYPQMSKIFRETAREYGVPYHEHKGYFGALRSHLMVLKALGQKPYKSSVHVGSTVKI